MKGTMTVIATDGSKTVTELSATPRLEALQKAVGGYLETVPYLDKFEGGDCVAFCNEEGKLNGLPPNNAAQEIWTQAYGQAITDDFLVGNVVIISGDDELMRAL